MKLKGEIKMVFRVDYEKTFNHGDYTTTNGGVLKSGFETYEEASSYVRWAKKHLIHDKYNIVEDNK